MAVLWAVAALLVRLVLNAVIGPRGSYLFFLLATLCSAAVGGFRFGLVTMLSGVLLAGFSRPPLGSFQLIDPSDPSATVRFLVSALVVSYVCELLIAARERARMAESRLEQSQRIYQAIGESIPLGIWICDADGRNRYASESLLKLTGMTQEECSASGWARALHPEDGQQILTKWQKCVDQAGIWDVEMRYRDTDGKYHPVLARGVPVRDENGKIVSWAGINLDISRLKEAQAELHQQAEELRRSNRGLEQFAFVASHDMQEPLRTVNIYTHLLLKKIKTDDSPELEQFAGFVRDGVQRMESLIRNLLEYSRVLQSETERQPVDAGRIAREALDICQVSAAQSGAEIDIGALPRVFVARHSSDRFSRIWFRMALNIASRTCRAFEFPARCMVSRFFLRWKTTASASPRNTRRRYSSFLLA